MTNYENLLINILAKRLKIDPGEISFDLAFAEQGMDSFEGLRFVRQVSEEVGIEIELEWILDYPTVRQLAGLLEEKSSQSSRDISAQVVPRADQV